tara:strand:- start:466 stop:579 length:114 start_codon:yes stop_codon:yes gene_type:complete
MFPIELEIAKAIVKTDMIIQNINGIKYFGILIKELII